MEQSGTVWSAELLSSYGTALKIFAGNAIGNVTSDDVDVIPLLPPWTVQIRTRGEQKAM